MLTKLVGQNSAQLTNSHCLTRLYYRGGAGHDETGLEGDRTCSREGRKEGREGGEARWPGTGRKEIRLGLTGIEMAAIVGRSEYV